MCLYISITGGCLELLWNFTNMRHIYIYNLLVKGKLAPVVCLFILSIWTLLALIRWTHWHFYSISMQFQTWNTQHHILYFRKLFFGWDLMCWPNTGSTDTYRTLLITSVAMELYFFICWELSVLLFCTSLWLYLHYNQGVLLVKNVPPVML